MEWVDVIEGLATVDRNTVYLEYGDTIRGIMYGVTSTSVALRGWPERKRLIQASIVYTIGLTFLRFLSLI